MFSIQRQAVILNASVPTGAFGTAVLYRKVADDTLVVIKEVNMIDLTASERQMALNEVQVLSSLDHPNIIRWDFQPSKVIYANSNSVIRSFFLCTCHQIIVVVIFHVIALFSKTGNDNFQRNQVSVYYQQCFTRTWKIFTVALGQVSWLRFFLSLAKWWNRILK